MKSEMASVAPLFSQQCVDLFNQLRIVRQYFRAFSRLEKVDKFHCVAAPFYLKRLHSYLLYRLTLVQSQTQHP